MTTNEIIATSLKRFRKQFGLNQKDVAAVLGITIQAYQNYEYGKGSPSSVGIFKLADAYDVSTDYLLGRSDEPRPVPADKIMIEKIASCRNSIQELLAMVDKATGQAVAK